MKIMKIRLVYFRVKKAFYNKKLYLNGFELG